MVSHVGKFYDVTRNESLSSNICADIVEYRLNVLRTLQSWFFIFIYTNVEPLEEIKMSRVDGPKIQFTTENVSVNILLPVSMPKRWKYVVR